MASAALRGKLEPDPRNPELILTVRGNRHFLPANGSERHATKPRSGEKRLGRKPVQALSAGWRLQPLLLPLP